MITREVDHRKTVEFSEREALEHDTEFMTLALEAAGHMRGRQFLYESRGREDLMEQIDLLWKQGMRREWKEQRETLIRIAAIAGRNARIVYALSHPELCQEYSQPKPEAPAADQGAGS